MQFKLRPAIDAVPRARLAARLHGLRPSLYARILRRLEAFEGEVFPFHIGESHRLPAPAIREALQVEADDRAIHRYAHPQGMAALREAIAARLNRAGRPEVTAEHVLVTHGATHGLSLACQAVLDPGDEVLVLSPHWPLITGMIHTACAVPVEVPFTSRPESGAEAPPRPLSSYVTPRTRAVYLTSPNNPDGAVLTAEQLGEVARLCVGHDLFAFADEAYEQFHYVDRAPPLATFAGMAERTISLFTFSKTHRMAGLRVGYVVAPEDLRDAMTRLANISVYNVSLLMQRAALAATGCEEDAAQTAAEARVGRDVLCEALAAVDGVRFRVPDGGAYVFAELSGLLGGADCYDLLEQCLDQGIVFSPGEGFGAEYGSWARFCFTAMDEPTLRRGAERLVAALRAFRPG